MVKSSLALRSKAPSLFIVSQVASSYRFRGLKKECRRMWNFCSVQSKSKRSIFQWRSRLWFRHSWIYSPGFCI